MLQTKSLLSVLSAFALAMPAVAAGHKKPAAPAGPALKLPKPITFGNNETALPGSGQAAIDQVHAYLEKHVEITALRVEGHPDGKDKGAKAEEKAGTRAWAVAQALVTAGVDCKRLVVVGNVKLGWGITSTVGFISAALKGKPIGGARLEGGGKSAGDLCSGKRGAVSAPAGQDDKHAGKSGGSSGPPSVVCGAAGLSEARKKMFAELDQVIPSIQGQGAHSGGRNLFDGTHQMTQAEVDEKHEKHIPIATTCGLLPGVMLKHLGLKGPLTANGTEGLRLCGHGMGEGVFVEADGTNLPKPGDLYWLRYPKTPNTDSVAHVGIICQTGDAAWKTVDAGQGSATRQEAQIVTRRMHKTDGTHQFLSGPGTVGDSADFRRIGGWIDLDALMANQDKAAALKLKIKGNSATCK